MGKNTRNRNSIALSEKGLTVVQQAYHLSHFRNYEIWADFSLTSVSTIKRLLGGKAIDKTKFYALLEALDLNVDDVHILRKNEFIKSPKLLIGEIKTSNSQGGIFMTGTFTKDNYTHIERVLRHLQSLLIGGKVKFNKDKRAVTVSGDFCEENKIHIEQTIEELENLFSTLKVTW